MGNGSATTTAPSTASTRAALCESARRSIERRGWSRTTLAGVARDAGLTTGAIYSQFRGADHLLLETILTTQPRALPLLERSRTLEEAVRALVTSTAAVLQEPGNRNVVSATAHLIGVMVQDDELGAAYRAHAETQAVAHGAALAALAEADGSALRHDPVTAAHALAIMMSGLGQALALGLDPMDVDTAVDTILAAICDRP